MSDFLLQKYQFIRLKTENRKIKRKAMNVGKQG
jgi:hypothetical protein